MPERFGDVSVDLAEDLVATVEIHRPPANYFDAPLIAALADAYEALAETRCRCIVLSSEGRHFCAGADFTGQSEAERMDLRQTSVLYREAVRLFEAPLPVVAAVQGAAIGGGLGLACSADFRVAAVDSRFVANFALLGIHHGFGLSVTLPAIVGRQRALELLFTGRRLDGREAASIGLCDRVAPAEDLAGSARELAREVAVAAPLAVRSIRSTMRRSLAEAVRQAVEEEAAEQARLCRTEDYREGVAAVRDRRPANFTGR
jgi:enoyl-CoA hydratase/carnithine racemase